IINGLLSILTFKNESLLKVGCGIYLLTNSFISILTITIFTIKYFQLIIFQMKSITNTSFISFSCILTDVLLKILLTYGDWLYAAVAIERALSAIQGVHFNKSKIFRIRVKTKKKSAYKKILYAQIQQNKHLLISPSVLILLSIPRLIISFLSGCMESIRTPWLYLTGYYISFIPPLLIIILFILPSKTYKEEFISIIKKINFISK
ncbi:unnamed protein product, partial [Adineta steineri]